jgi:hypothetical protein
MTTRTPTFESYLRERACSDETRQLLGFLETAGVARFDPVTGHLPDSYFDRDGIDGTATISTFASAGFRTPHVYASRPCRINTYGNSFVQGNQVSDAETWQEYLAGHIGEPIRNFGVGGFGVYQAYRRMVREEQADHAAEHVIFYVWGNDHERSLNRCGALFWANVEVDLETGRIVERESLLPTQASVLANMADPEWMVQALEGDLALNMTQYAQGTVSDVNVVALRKLASHLDFDPGRLASDAPDPAVIWELLDRYSLAATKYTLSKAQEFVDRHGKKLLVVLFDPVRVVKPLLEGRPRWDQDIVDFLDARGMRSFDMNLVHVEDFKTCAIPFERYMDRYFVMRVPFEQREPRFDRYLPGHYSPRGNHLLAYAIAPTIASWLDPKPMPYQSPEEGRASFEAMLASAARITPASRP